MGFPCQHIIQRQMNENVTLKIADIKCHRRFYKARPIQGLKLEPVWDSWPANLSRPQTVTFIASFLHLSLSLSCSFYSMVLRAYFANSEISFATFLKLRTLTHFSENDQGKYNEEMEWIDSNIDIIPYPGGVSFKPQRLP